jgi:hypothetical protein
VTEYAGLVFAKPDKVDLKVWKANKEHDGLFEPNRRTKVGREMSEFLLNGLQGNKFTNLLDALKMDFPHGRFSFPWMEICGEVIILFLHGEPEIKDKNVIEITKREFDELAKLPTKHKEVKEEFEKATKT